jgi:hypothetical protein
MGRSGDAVRLLEGLDKEFLAYGCNVVPDPGRGLACPRGKLSPVLHLDHAVPHQEPEDERYFHVVPLDRPEPVELMLDIGELEDLLARLTLPQRLGPVQLLEDRYQCRTDRIGPVTRWHVGNARPTSGT